MPGKRTAKQKSREKQARSLTIATYLQRQVEIRNELPRFLIVCEGEQTEPNYFEALAAEIRVSVNVQVKGLGDNTDSLVRQAIALKDQDDYVQAWCVFDRDSFPKDRFNRAITLAEEHGLQVAYSNQAFELWYILHFEYLQAGLERKAYKAKLSRHLGKKYEKNSLTIYHELSIRQPIAIRNAARLLATYDPPNPEADNPSTKVHLLVQELNKFRRD